MAAPSETGQTQPYPSISWLCLCLLSLAVSRGPDVPTVAPLPPSFPSFPLALAQQHTIPSSDSFPSNGKTTRALTPPSPFTVSLNKQGTTLACNPRRAAPRILREQFTPLRSTPQTFSPARTPHTRLSGPGRPGTNRPKEENTACCGAEI